jgi:TonB family protein
MSLATRAVAAGLLCASALVALAQDAPLRAGAPGVPVPKRVKVVLPTYPPEAQAQGLRGIVILELTIDAQGNVAEAKVVRSVPPFDEAARAAALQWKYEPVQVDGKAVTVVLTVPITFALKLPELDRAEGIPELRQGANPGIPTVPQPRPATVKAAVTLDDAGYVADAQVTAGEPPWDEALLLALRTWRFAVASDAPPVAFDVEAVFPVPGKDAVVALKLTNPREATAASPAPPAEPTAVPASPTPPLPESTPAPSDPPSPAVPPAVPSPEPTASAPAPPTPSPEATPVPTPTPRVRREPPTEILTPTTPTPPPTPPPIPVSSVRDVEVQVGVPDLTAGRRPVVPPVARIQRVSGTVNVRFAVDGSGAAQVQAVDGPELLQEAARQTVASWVFRRNSLQRLYLAAAFTYEGDTARAVVSPSTPFAPPSPAPPAPEPSPAPSPAAPSSP